MAGEPEGVAWGDGIRRPEVTIGYALLDWRKVLAAGVPVMVGLTQVGRGAIEAQLAAGELEDAREPRRWGKPWNSAARVAWLVEALLRGETLDPITVRASYTVTIPDGNHRFRAYEYLGRLDAIPATLRGRQVDRLKGCWR